MSAPRRVAIVGGLRIPFCRAGSHYANASNKDMLTAVMKALVDRYGLKGQRLGDVAAGATFKHPRDWNLAREALLDSGLARDTPAFDLQRACGTSLSACVLIAHKIALGNIEAGIGAGVDSISDLPLEFTDRLRRTVLAANRAKTLGKRLGLFSHVRPGDLKPQVPGVVEPHTRLNMGQSCERMARAWKVSRESQDKLALASHTNAARAWDDGFYRDLVVPFAGAERDNNVRSDSSLEKLAKLRTSFAHDSQATLTAGNSSPLTDGAAGVLLASEDWARERGLPIQAWLMDSEVAAVNFIDGDVAGDGLLMAPTYAVSRMLARNKLVFDDFDFFEIHEAFAAQVLCTLKAWEDPEFSRRRLDREPPLGEVDRAKLNIRGGSVALGHPFGATGARIVATLAKLLGDKGSGRGLISICTGGGMGVTAILQAAEN
ncbi:MAG TPA: acetyl-CoA C-acetyltransferase [Gammaproteobacteria bacterium]|nr:acetyl-CoA C-acetyltransferase [Gammaproteobacteria bacterium]